jgi:ketosteroid isomerase-like protein
MPATETDRVGRRLVELMRAGKSTDAIRELYADNARHVEPMEMPGGPYKRITEGKAALLAKADDFDKNVEVHDAHCSDPQSNGDQFICQMGLDCTAREGPMAGQRMKMNEFAQYTVKDGKIAEAKFFYGCGA